LDKYNVKIIGVKADAIERGEDREAFKDTMKKLAYLCRVLRYVFLRMRH